jgi:hypothetical protein
MEQSPSLTPDQDQCDRQEAGGNLDPNVSRPKITDVTYLLGHKSRTL